jgi:hypothetical protein
MSFAHIDLLAVGLMPVVSQSIQCFARWIELRIQTESLLVGGSSLIQLTCSLEQ